MEFDELKENPARYIKSLAMDLVVVLVAFAYIFYQMLTFETTQLNPLILIAESIMGIVCGIVIKQALGENGFSKGYNSKIWEEEEKKYNDSCNTAIGYIDRVDNFYLSQEIHRKEMYRRQHLQCARLKYDMWFDKEGNYIGTKERFKALDLKQKLVLKKCITVKIHTLNLFSEYETSTDQDTQREMTDKLQRSKMLTKNTISATTIAIIGVYFIPILNNWSWAAFVGATLQVVLWVLFGVLQLYTNYNFVVKEKVSILRRKKELISKFTKECDKGNYIHNPYENVEKSVDTNN